MMIRVAIIACFAANRLAFAQPHQPVSLAPLETSDGVVFQCLAPGATTAHVVADFNRYAENDGGRIPARIASMSGPDSNGIFRTVIALAPGVYRYKFALDGGRTWFTPAYAYPRDAEGNAYLVVDGIPDSAPHAAEAQPPRNGPAGVTFEFFAPDAWIVYLAGEFNRWAENRDGQVTDHRFAMQGPDEFGIWRTTVRLAPGRHLYQFVINGDEWIPDPLGADIDAQNHSILEVTR